MGTRGLDHWVDIVVVAVYFVFVLSVGLWSMCTSNRGSVRGYFLAGSSMSWWPVGASIFSSNIGSEHFLGLAGTGAASGIAIVLYEWNAIPLVILLAWVFLPVYVSAGVYTLPEYLGKRFGGTRLRMYLSVLTLVLYIVTKIAVSIYAGALFIQLALGWDMYLAVVALLAITGLFTVLGGLAAVIYTDTFQTVVMLGGALALTVISFNKIGGYDNLVRKYGRAVANITNGNATCGIPRDDAFHLFRDPVTSDNPWPGLISQSTLGVLWYFCCDQVIVQRSLAAKNLSHAKGGSLLAGMFKILPMFIMILPGMISRALYPDEVACVNPKECSRICSNPVGCSNIAYPKLVLELLPVGIRGLLMAVMMSAIITSLTSIFNSASALFTMDLWRKVRSSTTERELLIVGRVFIVVLCGISILWIPLVKSSQGGQLFIYLQAVQAYLGTPIGPVFIWAILWKRMNEKAAFWGLITGHTCGIIRMVLDFVYPAPNCGEPDIRPPLISGVHYTYYGMLLLGVTSVSIVIISLLTKPQDSCELEGYTWWTLPIAHRPGCGETGKEAKTEDSISENNGEVLADESNRKYNREDTCGKRWIGIICGLPNSTVRTSKTEHELNRIDKFLYERPRTRTLLNVLATVSVGALAYLWGFFH
ncbi:sodium/mannose cotransporter SLC5A10-like [Liolophura sinensis]|uniref:sodium/mannose cotransporter SLC5A10-like n=1 Tax=Liolophura sinensis TaxID=3198878 RepID=UPI0031583852